MVRWSRRFAAGEQTKDKLKDILEEVSSRKDWVAGSVEQLIGDFYGACMDESKVNQLGLAPLKPLLGEIDAMRSRKDVERMIARFHDLAIPMPFALFSNSDNHNPSQVIADVGASGIGLPDRDYYFKPEPRFEDSRKKYRVHIANMFRLAGSPKRMLLRPPTRSSPWRRSWRRRRSTTWPCAIRSRPTTRRPLRNSAR
jgi:endothelin-converting enzyme/putative endopeptidase